MWRGDKPGVINLAHNPQSMKIKTAHGRHDPTSTSAIQTHHLQQVSAPNRPGLGSDLRVRPARPKEPPWHRGYLERGLRLARLLKAPPPAIPPSARAAEREDP
jgi:hypothetical protein